MFYYPDSLVQWSAIIFAINMSGLLSRRWGNGSNDPRAVLNSDEYLWRYDSNSDWYTCCSTCNAGIAFQVISMYRILWASRINSKPQSFAECLLLCFYASATCRVGLVAVKHFQVSTQRCIYVYFYIYFRYIYIYELLALLSDVSTQLEHIYMFEIMWFEISWHIPRQITEEWFWHFFCSFPATASWAIERRLWIVISLLRETLLTLLCGALSCSDQKSCPLQVGFQTFQKLMLRNFLCWFECVWY